MSFQQTILSGLLTHGKDAWNEHGLTLSADMFDGDLMTVYQTIEALYSADRFVDVVTVAEKIPDYADLVRHIASNFSSAATLGAHIKELQIQHSENRARDIGAQLMATGDYEAAQVALDGLGDTSARGGTVDASTALAALWDEVQANINHEHIGLETGLSLLDDKLGGMVAGDLILLAARPSQGKTALMLNIAQNVAGPVGIFSLEMPTHKLMARMVSAQGIDHGRLKRPRTLTEGDWEDIGVKGGKVKTELFINDIGGLSLSAMESEARRMVNKHGCGLICIDYLQLITHKAERRLEVVSEVSRRLKALAKNLKVPVIALSQLNRESENTINPVITLSQLRESGQLEQDADIVIFINRPETKDETNRPGEADLIIAKNRDGEIGTVAVAWQGHYQRFMNLTHKWYGDTA